MAHSIASHFSTFLRLRFALYFLVVPLIGCTSSPTGRKQLLLVSDGDMAKLGHKSFSVLKAKQPIEHDPRTNAYVKCVAQAVIHAAADQSAIKDWEVVVFQDPSANAFALPGGKIGVHTGLLKVAETPDQLAAVLGHEVGHVLAKHGAERVSQTMATQVGLSVVDVLTQKNGQSNPYIMGGLGLGAQVGVLLPFSRKHESEADEMGLYLMAKAGFQPEASVALWQNMSKASRGAPPEFLSTHPAHKTRISELNSHMAKARSEYQRSTVRPQCSR